MKGTKDSLKVFFKHTLVKKMKDGLKSITAPVEEK